MRGRRAHTRLAPPRAPPTPRPSCTLPPARREEVADVYNTPLLDLVYSAATVHRQYNDPSMVRARAWSVSAASAPPPRPSLPTPAPPTLSTRRSSAARC